MLARTYKQIALSFLAGALILSCTPASERARFEPPPATAPATTAPATTVDKPPAALPPPATTPPALSPGLWTAVDEPGAGGRITGLAIDPFDSQHLIVGGDLIGAGVSTNGGATWQPALGLTNAEMARFTFHPTRRGEVWAATMGGPFVSYDGGLNWSERREGMPPVIDVGYSAPIEEIVLDAASPDRLLAFGGSHREWDAPGTSGWGVVWESTNGGASWSDISEVAEGTNVVDVATLADGTLLAAALGRGIYRSPDSGRSWVRSSEGLPHEDVRSLAAHPSDPAVVWVALGSSTTAAGTAPGGVWRSTDGGATWVDSSAGLDTSSDAGTGPDHTPSYHALVVAPTDPSLLMTANLAYGAEALYRSTDGGATWTQVVGKRVSNRPPTAYATPVTANAFAIDPRDAGRILAGNAEFVLGTTDRGNTWRDLTSDPNGDGTVTGRGFSGLVANRVVFSPDGAEMVLCGFDGANPLLSMDGGQSWDRPLRRSDPWGGCLDVSYSVTTPDRRYVLLGQAGIFGGVAVLEPDAKSFRLAAGIPAGLPERYSQVGVRGAIEAVRRVDGSEAVVVSVGGDVYVSDDGAQTFRPTLSDMDVADLTADAAQPGRLYLAAADGVHRSDDAGSTSAVLAGSPVGAGRMFLDNGSGRLYATVWRTAGAGLWRWETTGAWLRLSAEPTAFDVAVDPENPHHVILVTNDHPYHDRISSVGVLRSHDDGATFAPFNEGLPLLRVAAVAIDPAEPSRVVIGTYGRGWFETEATP